MIFCAFFSVFSSAIFSSSVITVSSSIMVSIFSESFVFVVVLSDTVFHDPDAPKEVSIETMANRETTSMRVRIKIITKRRVRKNKQKARGSMRFLCEAIYT